MLTGWIQRTVRFMDDESAIQADLADGQRNGEVSGTRSLVSNLLVGKVYRLPDTKAQIDIGRAIARSKLLSMKTNRYFVPNSIVVSIGILSLNCCRQRQALGIDNLNADLTELLMKKGRPLTMLHTVQNPKGSYGLGWQISNDPAAGLLLSHGGTNRKWYSRIWLAPDKKFAVVVACNSGSGKAAALCNDVINRFGTKYEILPEKIAP
ncbi:MAG: hypothetical protein ACI9R3_001718 [Verrucomicrobiales bacterium]|jgi:hypothetical protein